MLVTFGPFFVLIPLLGYLVESVDTPVTLKKVKKETYQNTVCGCCVTFSKRQTSLRLDPFLMYFSAGPSITALASAKGKKRENIEHKIDTKKFR